VLTDPYQPGAYDGALGLAPIREQADIVLISHAHEDHSHLSGLAGSPTAVRDSGEAQGVKFSAVDSFHDKSEGRERGKNKIFCFTLEGVRVCHLWDLGHVLGEQQVHQICGVDLLLVPVGGFFTIEPEEAAEVVRQIQPKVVIPMHFKVPKVGFPIKPVEDFLKTQSKVQRLHSSEVEVSAASLPSALTVYVLSPANG